METTLKEDGLIVAVKIKNLSFQEGAEFKADMELTIEKAGREIIKKYSLKLYGNPEVNVWNTSVPSLLVYLLGPEKKAEILAAFDQDKQFSDLVVKARRVNVEKNLAKKVSKGMSIDDAVKKFRYKFSDKFKAELEIAKKNGGLSQLISNKRMERGIYREKMNPTSAKILYQFLDKYFNDPVYKKKIIHTILKKIGFLDKDTNFLMALVGNAQIKAGKSKILDRHPELNLDDSKLIYDGGTGLRIVGPTGKTILKFAIKEGEKKAVASMISFRGVKPYELGK